MLQPMESGLQVQVKNTFLHFVHGSMEINEERDGISQRLLGNGGKLWGNAIIHGDLPGTNGRVSAG